MQHMAYSEMPLKAYSEYPQQPPYSYPPMQQQQPQPQQVIYTDQQGLYNAY